MVLNILYQIYHFLLGYEENVCQGSLMFLRIHRDYNETEHQGECEESNHRILGGL